jgi:ABC-type glycerol-3-phosphate transport system substrate-binding protein
VKATLAIVVIALLTLAGCSGGDDGGETTDTTAGGTETTEAPTEDLSSYETITDLNEDLAAAGIECTLEYEGLVDEVREISQCPIDGALAILTVWYDDGLLTDFLATDPAAVAYGVNWTVELSDPATATAVAEATGGTTTDA